MRKINLSFGQEIRIFHIKQVVSVITRSETVPV